ncbi:MAG: hypothetical protein ABUL65_00470 [Opitutus sp.]
MKTAVWLFGLLLCGLLAACHSPHPASANAPALRSERQYAEQSEARAQDLYKTGQVTSIEEARAQAAAEANQQWYAAAKARERQADQEKFEQDFKKSQASSP